MNTRPLSTLFLAAALCACVSVPAFASSDEARPASYTVRAVTVSSNGGIQIVRGMDWQDVSFAMKYKNRQELAPDIWAYSGFGANYDLANQQGCETVVIRFTGGKVADLKLVNQASMAVLTAGIKSHSTGSQLASK
jgi:hypothetical protein